VSQGAGGGGRVTRVNGPVVGASGLEDVRLHDVVRVGELGLIGEVIRISEQTATVQVYEDTSGVAVGEPVLNTGGPLAVELGPGLLGSVYDGLQRPLDVLAAAGGAFIERGASAPALSPKASWEFTPWLSTGEEVAGGDVLGVVAERPTVKHRVMVPPGVRGRLLEIRRGVFRTSDVVAILEPTSDGAGRQVELTLAQRWPVRRPRPVRARLHPREPLITGTRVIDTFFPVAKGGTAIIPGGFGTGKTVTEQSLARCAEVDIVVYVGCGERGNEMADVLEETRELEEPRTGAPLLHRTVLIANTSNMPVAAREASIYTGITIAEYYRDMGHDVLALADSTSRWGEALREVSDRLEEMPGEEGYPAYLAARLAEFYERAGRVTCLGRARRSQSAEPRGGSVTVVGAMSPPGADFSEPMTQSSMRVAGTFWALDFDLSSRRHFPAINWTSSYSLYDLRDWYAAHVGPDWSELTRRAMALPQREVELREIVQLVGSDALGDTDRAALFAARVLREDFLQQSAFHEVDRFCWPEKACRMLRAIMGFYDRTQQAVRAGVELGRVTGLPFVSEMARLKEVPIAEAPERIEALEAEMERAFGELAPH